MRSIILIACFGFSVIATTQDRLPTYPNYQQYQRMRSEIASSVVRASIRPVWSQDGKSVSYQRGADWFRFDFARGKESPSQAPTETSNGAAPRNNRGNRFPDRGRQLDKETSPDGNWTATYKDRNIWLSDSKGGNEVQITTEGNETKRIKFGIASWVYGEELGVRNAMWFSPDSKKLAFYRFDESHVLDYYLTLGQASIQSKLDVEPYPKAGANNPIADLFVYDLATQKTVGIDVRGGKPFTDDVLGHYVYAVRWSPDGKELYFNRTNRKQDEMEWVAADPDTGKCRVIVRESWRNSWTENSPAITWLDNQKFVWTSERNGFANYYLYDISGSLKAVLTKNSFDAAGIVRVDQKTGWMYYMARSGETPYKLQLHKVRLDGTRDMRLTDPKFNHTVSLSPDGSAFVDTYETHDTPPAVRLLSGDGKVLAELARSNDDKFKSLGLQKPEMFTFTSADGVTQCYGMLHKPSNFDPSKKYPLLVSVYAGPESGMLSERFTTPSTLTELGFLVASFDGRGTAGRGKAFKDAVYGKLGVVEIDDQAMGVRELAKRPYVDSSRVGIFGTSHGGYASLMCLLRHPDVFAAASASSAVTDWRNYDTIYTERYMNTPQQNPEGYRLGSAMTYAKELHGELMLYYGTADNNVHPANSLQLIQALGYTKHIEVQVGTDFGHSALNTDRMLEFFIEKLILKK